MKLNLNLLESCKEQWKARGYLYPQFDIKKTIELTKKEPTWLHFGAGNIFRAFPAAVLEKVLDSGKYDKGVIAVEGFDFEIIDKVYKPFDNLSILAVMKADGSLEKRIIASVADSMSASDSDAAWEKLKALFAVPSLQMVSFTVTEKGYAIISSSGSPIPVVMNDIDYNGLKPRHLMGKLASLLFHRYQNGACPIAMVSMDNCSHNGDRLRQSIMYYAEKWLSIGLVDSGFIEYLSRKDMVSFPYSMIDKITPRPDNSVLEILKSDEVENCEIVVTDKNTYTAPFVNAEEAEYLVIEDEFPNGRPPLELGGVIFTDRNTVENVEKMKVCTCLNPLHTAMSIFGCLLGHKLISEEMKDKDIVSLITKMAYSEGLPVVTDPKIIKPEEFLREVLEKRLPNPFLPDTPQRIACDTSQKLPIRFGITLNSYLEKGLNVTTLTYIPLVFAGYLRYLLGIDDNGNKMELSPDPLLDELCSHLSSIKLGARVSTNDLKFFYSNRELFGVDLYDIGLADKITSYFNELISAPGAVRKTLGTVNKF